MSKVAGFCPDCGTILPQLKPTGGIVCFLCEKEHSVDVFGDMYVEYTVQFNKVTKQTEEDDSDNDDGPVVEKQCKKCGHDKMSYKTLQLRRFQRHNLLKIPFRSVTSSTKFITYILVLIYILQIFVKMDNRSSETYQKAKVYWSSQSANHAGMLGNLPNLHAEDIKSSSIFLRQLFKYKPPLGKKRVLDCGAGIGRVSKNLLCEEFEVVDLLEQNEKFCEKAKEILGPTGKLGEIYCVGLQDFQESQHSYDVIWCQWFLGHLLDNDLVKSLTSLASMLSPHGMLVVKENFTESSGVIVDEVDSSVTRPLTQFKKLLKQANLRIVKESKQLNFPKDVFPVYMLAIKRIK